MVNSNNVTRKFTMKEKLASLGPGFVIVGSFIGPGTVTSCTLAGATYGFTLFWCVVFSVIVIRKYEQRDQYHHSGRSRRKHEA